jgi:preprotein translocase subunit SecA
LSSFATVREASARTLGWRHHDVQIVGGIVLHAGQIAEMRTGEGKTLTATLAAYLNALPAAGVHVMAASGYLAARDAGRMRPLYQFLGLSTGLITARPATEYASQRAGDAADVTYGAWDHFAHDYLRDHLAWNPDEVVQRGRPFCIVDDADLILIDKHSVPVVIAAETRTLARVPVWDYLTRYQQLAGMAVAYHCTLTPLPAPALMGSVRASRRCGNDQAMTRGHTAPDLESSGP